MLIGNLWNRLAGVFANRSITRSLPRETGSPIRRSWQPSLEVLEGREVPAGTGLTAQYYTDPNLSQLLLMRRDATVNVNLAAGKAPAAGMPASNYSIRWTGQIQANYTETYTFTTMSDDGIRLIVNGTTLINDWNAHSPKQDTATIALTAGQKYTIEVDYFQGSGTSVAQLYWSSAHTAKQIVPAAQLYPAQTVGVGTGLLAQYYNDRTLTNKVLSRTDANVNLYQTTAASPGSGVPSTNWSVRWTGQIQPTYSGTYTFYTNSDDGVRLYVNGQLLINNWTLHSNTQNMATITLVAGQKYNIEVDYFQGTGSAIAQLLWSAPNVPKAIVPMSQLYPITPVGSSPPPPPTTDWFSQNLNDPNVATLARSLYQSDQVLSRSDVLQLFTKVEQDNTVSANELNDLRKLVGSASISMPDPVRNLFNKVVNTNAANAKYQGTALGNIAAGNAGSKLQKLVNKWFLGLDHPGIPGDAHYVTAAGNLFGASGPLYTDIVQGKAQDCYLLAGLGEVALRTPNSIRSMFIDNGDGTWTIRFYNNGATDYVTVDRALPATSAGQFYYVGMGKSTTATTNVLWVALAEKGYAQLAESGWSRQTATNNYSAINIGWEGDVIEQIVNRNETAQVLYNTTATLTAIVNAFNAGGLIGLDTNATTASGITSNHVYIMTGYNATTHMFTLYNPWGYTQQLSWAQVTANFSSWSMNVS